MIQDLIDKMVLVLLCSRFTCSSYLVHYDLVLIVWEVGKCGRRWECDNDKEIRCGGEGGVWRGGPGGSVVGRGECGREGEKWGRDGGGGMKCFDKLPHI